MLTSTGFSYRKMLLAGTGALAMAATDAALAQDKLLETVVVTGSRIARPDLTTPSPINSIGEEEVRASGETNIAELLNDQPQFGASFGATSQNYSSLAAGFGNGTELVNLRNLGAQRTLVLVNGRRHVGGDPGTSSVDLNSIPFAMVDRVDVVSGAASAVYGADAVSGVVNIILKTDFEGAEFSVSAGTSDEGGAENYQVSGLFGDTFANDRGSALFSVEYDRSEGLIGADREHSSVEGVNFTIGGGAGSAAIPGGLILSSNGALTVDPSGGLVPWDGTRYQRIGFRGLDNPTKRLIASTAIDYDIVGNADGFSATGYVEASYAQVNSVVPYEPLPLIFDGNVNTPNELPFTGPRIPANNPFLQPFLPTLGTVPPEGLQLFRRLVEYGPRTTEVDRDTFRLAGGVRGNVNSDWTYDVYYQYGRVDSLQRDTGALDRFRFFAGLDVESDGAGGLQCVDPRYRQLGCTPVNLFAPQGITQEFIDYTTIESLAATETRQHVVSGYATGSLFSLPAGEVTAVIGAEYRDEQTEVRPDDSYTNRSNSNRFLDGVEGGYDVAEVFGEVRVPLLADRPGFQELTLGLAGRYSDYSTIGGEFSHSASLEWRPTQTLLLRGVYATAVRAPNIGELFAPTSRVVVSLSDPCDTLDDTSQPISITGPRATACAMDLGGLATNFEQTQIQRQTVGAISGGNTNLDAESGRTFTVGGVFTPDGALKGAALSVDYIDIEIDDVITSLTPETIINSCYDDPSRPAALCGAVIRDGSTGQLLSVQNFVFNAASERVRALDLKLEYSTRLGLGDLSLEASWSHLFKHDLLTDSTAALDDRTGQIGDFENRYSLGAAYDINDLTVRWDTRILGSGIADTTIDIDGNDIDAVSYHDLRVDYELKDGRYRLTAGVENLFDKQPPIVTSPARTLNSSGLNTATSIYDVRGRYFYTGLTAKF